MQWFVIFLLLVVSGYVSAVISGKSRVISPPLNLQSLLISQESSLSEQEARYIGKALRDSRTPKKRFLHDRGILP
jgi:hypothetical protein